MKKIYINPGHSDTDSGAVGYATERKLNVAVSKHMNEYLLEHYVCETRMNPGSMDSLAAICKDANNWGADLFVSNHFNAAGGDGFETFVYSEKRVDLGKIFAKHVKAAGQNLRSSSVAPGVKIRPGLYVLKNTNMTAILNEGAFVDNLKDIQDWDEDHELKKLGIAYAKAAAEYLGLEKKQGNTVSVTLPVLSKGSKGESVKSVQMLLAGWGYKVGVTGNFGNGTKKAVEAAQVANDLPVTGVCNAETWCALLRI